MITLKDLDKATLDNTNVEEFEKMLKQYFKDNHVVELSKQQFYKIISNL